MQCGVFNSGYTSKTIDNLQTADNCQKECQKDLNCTIFSYDFSTDKCQLKYYASPLSTSSVSAAGAKYCPGEYKLLTTSSNHFDLHHLSAYFKDAQGGGGGLRKGKVRQI